MDPRDIITPEAVVLAPELLGTPLARPRRRAAAMLVDLALVAILVRFIDSMFLPLIAGVLFWRISRPDPARGFVRRSALRALRVTAMVLLVFFAVKAFNGISSFIAGAGDELPEPPRAVEQLAEQRAAAVAAGTTVPDTTRIVLLERAVQALRQQNTELRGMLEEARERRGFRRIIAAFADDLGLGFGWFALYFSAFLVLWQGQTPGKRVFRLRVIRLDGKPMTWWLSFERFGGYAASFATGLLGFAQLLWDRNRQALHDKAAGTVVIQLPH